MLADRNARTSGRVNAGARGRRWKAHAEKIAGTRPRKPLDTPLVQVQHRRIAPVVAGRMVGDLELNGVAAPFSRRMNRSGAAGLQAGVHVEIVPRLHVVGAAPNARRRRVERRTLRTPPPSDGAGVPEPRHGARPHQDDGRRPAPHAEPAAAEAHDVVLRCLD